MYRIFKRCFDFIAAVVLFICISPLFLLLACMVRNNLGSPVFYKQVRSGKNLKPFMLIKFRTMANTKDAEGNLLPDEQRITKFGSWLRASSLDELPELINIIKGDMAVIGPRPLPPLYNDYFTEEEMARFSIDGGLIPPESLYHDSKLSWSKQLKHEAEYARKFGLLLDIRLLISVFKTIFRRTETDYGDYVREPLSVERANMKKEEI